MKHLRSFKLFENKEEETLHIFDFDDTIVDSPSFEELAIEYLKEDVTIKEPKVVCISFDATMSFVITPAISSGFIVRNFS